MVLPDFIGLLCKLANGPLRRTLHMHVSRRAATRKKKKKSSFTLLSLKKKITFWSEGRCRRTLSQP
jgi:hypothetical protein